MQKKSLIKSRAATKKALIASRKGNTGKVKTASVAAGVVAGTAPSGAVAGSAPSPTLAVTGSATPTGALCGSLPNGSLPN